MKTPQNVSRNLVRTSQFELSLAAVISGLLTIVKTGITIVSYFGNVTASLFALTIVRNLRLGDPKQYRLTIVIPKQGSWVRACLHGGGRPQVGEVTRLGEVKK